jgi:hypothetical protein
MTINQKIPPILYRFRPWSVLKSDAPERKSIAEIEERFAFFSSPTRFNDAQDNLLGPEFTGGKGDWDRLFGHGFADAIKLTHKQKCGITELDSSDPEFQEAERQYKRREARKNTCVGCFSWDWSDPLMWTFYAQEQQGFCLGYSTESEMFSRARPVLYTHSPTDVLHLKDSTADNDPLSFCKSTDWQFEKEWRVCLPEPGPKRINFKNEKLVSVHIGYRMSDPHLQELANALKKGGYKPEDTKLFGIERINMSFILCQRPIRW